jgi:hypothetical protein
MTAAFAVAAAVAVAAILAWWLTARKAAAQVTHERSRADQLAAELGAAQEARVAAEQRLQRDEQALGAAVQRADVSEQRATDAEGRLVAADALWELEHLRLQREWQEVTGTPAPLPEPWDGSVRAAIAVELEIIREVIGIPTRLEPDGPARPASLLDPVTALGTVRLTGEILRSLARVGEEMVVAVEADGSVTMAVAIEGTGPGPDLSRLAGTAAALGGELAVRPLAGGLEARLRPPAPAW